jgi:uncharacterized phosphatase
LTETVIGLLRHGQTDWNIDFRLQGVTDVPLNETGMRQARLAATAIRSEDWDFVLTSPLSRAKETARIVVELSGLPEPQIENLLLERSFGEAEGLRHEEWRANYPDTNNVPGAETLETLEDRAWRLLDHLAANYAGRRVLTVSHGALIRKLLGMVSQGEFPRDGERLSNASLSIFTHGPDGWRITEYSPGELVPLDTTVI